jgi:ElaB/YqjD/DUF883 family membrane-anchored ribosome-binding protein
VANRTPGLTSEASPDQIQQEMQETRESLTEKVAALENQVMGTIQTAADTVTDTVDAVKDAVSSAPDAVSDTMKQTVAAVKQSFQDTIGSISVTGCVRSHPLETVGASLVTGFLAGYFIGGSSRDSNANLAARAPTGYSYEPARAVSAPSAPSEPGLFSGIIGMVSRELRQIAEESLNTALQSLKTSVGAQVPQVVDSAVHRLTDQLQGAVPFRGGNGVGPGPGRAGY